ncbi:DUF1499 domain-containing protein [Gammaproteobacteria bacterium]|jgi:uncharacterized protein (DUF1499 family)|nr:DUF1499 domain-containing protein [Pseudomonadales bacterium]MBT5719051.1 DUF1499 domain-containing protein [Gammaproteobacteria bacterium]MBT6482084.1 DUF1499 domain-containing protein [Gammaproteobacteria bacterium]MBT7226789.1 DUF1499 domain-containing protein [Gammaproteobacteria bacterium]MDB3898087.1 DUF1499 domain-containing protein [Gammaproteobacteria bacterium]
MKKSLLALLPFLTACAGEPPQNIGVRDGRLSPCPESPNCVSSFESDEEHSIAALDATLAQIQRVVLALDEANIVEQSSDYMYVEFTSRLMGYVDDVEFLYDSASNQTHVRSASRLGYSDLGANRKRIEAIRTQL